MILLYQTNWHFELIMSNVPLISVVIPCFNEEKYIGRCLESVCNQNFKNYEVIVVDNNCTDKTVKIAEGFKVKIIREKKQGMTPARERGFQEAKSEIIARTDADTIIPSNWLSSIYKYFNLDPQMVALTGGFSFPEVSLTEEKLLSVFINASYSRHMKLVMGHYQLNGPNYALRKSAWEKVEIHADDKIVHEDMDLACHLYELGEIKYFPNLKVGYSLRRWKKKFWQTMFYYGVRNIRTVLLHHPKFIKHRKFLTFVKKSS